MANEIFDEQHGAARRELWDLIKDVRIAMLTTVDPDGRLHSRPMATQEVEPDDVLWFFSAKDLHEGELFPQVRSAGVDLVAIGERLADRRHQLETSGL